MCDVCGILNVFMYSFIEEKLQYCMCDVCVILNVFVYSLIEGNLQ